MGPSVPKVHPQVETQQKNWRNQKGRKKEQGSKSTRIFLDEKKKRTHKSGGSSMGEEKSGVKEDGGAGDCEPWVFSGSGNKGGGTGYAVVWSDETNRRCRRWGGVLSLEKNSFA